MALVTKIELTRGRHPRAEVRIALARVVSLLVLAVVTAVAAAILHGLDKETAAAWFTGMGEALIFLVLGAVVGEASGARDVAEQVDRDFN